MLQIETTFHVISQPVVYLVQSNNTKIYTAVIKLQLAPVNTVRAPVESTLPLSCAFTIVSDIVIDSTLMFEWNKLTSSGKIPVTDASNTTVTVYRSSRGIEYYISTLLLCDLEFSDAGAYECTAQAILMLESERESIASPTFNISVHGMYNNYCSLLHTTVLVCPSITALILSPACVHVLLWLIKVLVLSTAANA